MKECHVIRPLTSWRSAMLLSKWIEMCAKQPRSIWHLTGVVKCLARGFVNPISLIGFAQEQARLISVRLSLLSLLLSMHSLLS